MVEGVQQGPVLVGTFFNRHVHLHSSLSVYCFFSSHYRQE